MDLEQHSRLGTYLVDLIEVALSMARSRSEVQQKFEQAEERLREISRDVDRLKREKSDDRESYAQRERKYQDERGKAMTEVERLRTQQEELQARCEYFRSQNDSLQTTLAQAQQHQATGGASATQQGQGQQQQQHRLSHLVTKEVIDQITSIHEQLKSLEARTTLVSSSAASVDTRAMEMGKLAETSREVLKNSLVQLEQARNAHRDAVGKSRTDALTISALNLDVEGLQEQVNRLREEVANLNQHRRSLEAELEKTKLTVASSIIPLLEKSVVQQQSPAAVVASTAALSVVLVAETKVSDDHKQAEEKERRLVVLGAQARRMEAMHVPTASGIRRQQTGQTARLPGVIAPTIRQLVVVEASRDDSGSTHQLVYRSTSPDTKDPSTLAHPTAQQEALQLISDDTATLSPVPQQVMQGLPAVQMRAEPQEQSTAEMLPSSTTLQLKRLAPDVILLAEDDSAKRVHTVMDAPSAEPLSQTGLAAAMVMELVPAVCLSDLLSKPHVN